MPRRKLPEETKDQIARILVELSNKEADRDAPRRVSANWVHSVFVERHGGGRVSLRKVSDWLRQFPVRDPVMDSSWEPWTDDTESSEESTFLLRLRFYIRMIYGYGRSLSVREATWAKRIRTAIAVLDSVGQVIVVTLYALRERVSRMTGETLDTADLDAWLVVRPEVGLPAYKKLVSSGVLRAVPDWFNEWGAIKEQMIDRLKLARTSEFDDLIVERFEKVGRILMGLTGLGRGTGNKDTQYYLDTMIAFHVMGEGETISDLMNELFGERYTN